MSTARVCEKVVAMVFTASERSRLHSVSGSLHGPEAFARHGLAHAGIGCKVEGRFLAAARGLHELRFFTHQIRRD